jgi:hypothetical protein
VSAGLQAIRVAFGRVHFMTVGGARKGAPFSCAAIDNPHGPH